VLIIPSSWGSQLGAYYTPLDDILSFHETTNKLQAQLYDVQNQNCEYEARFKQISFAASFRIMKTKSSFVDGEPLPWKFDDNRDSPPPPKE
jgi:hypothetical protein